MKQTTVFSIRAEALNFTYLTQIWKSWFDEFSTRDIIQTGDDSELEKLQRDILECFIAPPLTIYRHKRLDTNHIVYLANRRVLLFERAEADGWAYTFQYDLLFEKVGLGLPTVSKTARGLEWKLDGKLHNIYDRPAVEISNGDRKEWWVDGTPWRDFDMPNVQNIYAVHWAGPGGQFYRANGKLPVMIQFDGMLLWNYTTEYGQQYFKIDPNDNWELCTVGTPIFTKTAIEWRVNGKLSRGQDLPTRITYAGQLEWFVDGARQRISIDTPARVKYTYLGGERVSTKKVWYRGGLKERFNDQPAKICDAGDPKWPHGCMRWYKGDLLHRLNAPAIIADGHESYWDNGVEVDAPTMFKIAIDQPLLGRMVVEVVDKMEEDTDCFVCCDVVGKLYSTVPCGHARYICEGCLSKLRLKMECSDCRSDITMYMPIFRP